MKSKEQYKVLKVIGKRSSTEILRLMRKRKGMRTKKKKNKDKWPQLALLKIL